tara:strand:+ start:1344 stop:1919 length:576 start_codon:yes stop_codon:yes gene_type:complete
MKIKLIIPESYADISVAQYKKMLDKWENNKGAEAVQKVLEVFCGAEKGLVNRIHVEELNKITRELTWLFREPQLTDFSLHQSFLMDGVEYGFIPNMQEVTVGEFADMETFMEAGMYENMQEMLALLYRPIVRKKAKLYEIETYSPSQIKVDMMGECKMDVAIGAVVFFYRIASQLAQSLQHYSPVVAAPTK